MPPGKEPHRACLDRVLARYDFLTSDVCSETNIRQNSPFALRLRGNWEGHRDVLGALDDREKPGEGVGLTTWEAVSFTGKSSQGKR